MLIKTDVLFDINFGGIRPIAFLNEDNFVARIGEESKDKYTVHCLLINCLYEKELPESDILKFGHKNKYNAKITCKNCGTVAEDQFCNCENCGEYNYLYQHWLDIDSFMSLDEAERWMTIVTNYKFDNFNEEIIRIGIMNDLQEIIDYHKNKSIIKNTQAEFNQLVLDYIKTHK